MIPTNFGRYQIEGEIGRGGMGIVYRATDLRLNRQVAIKVLGGEYRSTDTAWGLLLREARIISALKHYSICTIYDVGTEDEQPYIAMEYVEGCPLSKLVVPGGLRPQLVAFIARQLASALAHAHERGVIHRDIKSSNVMVTNQGGLKVLDFGLAKIVGPSVVPRSGALCTSSKDFGHLMGTIHCVAPEVLRGERANVWSDIWSTGVLLYEVATGQLPFRGKTVFELATAIMVSDPKPSPRAIPEWTTQVIAKCLERDFVRRYRCMRDILADLPEPGINDFVEVIRELDRFHSRPARAKPAKVAAV